MSHDRGGEGGTGSRCDESGQEAAAAEAMARAGHLAFSVARFQALCVAVRLGLADQFQDGPRRAADVAEGLGVDPGALTRLVRFLTVEGWFAYRGADQFSLTPLGRSLCRSAAGGVREFVVAGAERGWPVWGALAHSVATGQPAFDHVFGRTYFEDVATDPVQRAAVSRLLDDGARDTVAALAATYDFSGVRRLVDVGGGGGVLVGELLRLHPQLTAVLLDRHEAVDRASARLGRDSRGERCQFVEGDFFSNVPADGDLYILSWVLHDWDDRGAGAILSNCAKAMGRDARLLVLETLMTENPVDAPQAVALDLGMLVMTGGRERTEAEYRELLESAGLRLVRVLPTPSSRGTSILEAVPASAASPLPPTE